MWKTIKSSHNFSFNENISDYLISNNLKVSGTCQDLNDYHFILDPFLDDNNFTQKNSGELFQIDNENFGLFKDLEDFSEINNLKEKYIKHSKDEEYIINKSYIQAIQLKAKEKIYLKRPFKEKKILGRKKKSNEGLGEHNKFSDDNIIRKCKNVIIDSVLKFINDKTKKLYSNESEKLLNEKRLFKLKQNQSIKSGTNYNKTFLKKTLREIFSENISTKYSRYSPSHNKVLIEFLINEKDEIKKNIFNKIFNLTFLDCLKHFRGSVLFDELKGMNLLNKYIKEIKNDKNDEEYCIVFRYFINNLENIVMEKKSRKKRSKNNI